MFKDNKYSVWYSALIDNARTQCRVGYTERHHIIPRCMGGADTDDNLVRLTAREHFIAHLLLTKMVHAEYMEKIVYAAWQQARPPGKSRSNRPAVRINSRTYAYLREELSRAKSGTKRAPFSNEWLANMKAAAKTRRKVTPTKEATANRRVAAISRCLGKPNGRKGQSLNLSAERLSDLSQHFSSINKDKPKTRVCCIHCKKEVTVNTLVHHLRECKLNPAYSPVPREGRRVRVNGIEYRTVNEAARVLGLAENTIIHSAQGKRRSRKCKAEYI